MPISRVSLTEPPPSLIPDLTASIHRAVEQLPEGKTTAVVGVFTETGMNLAVVAKINDNWTTRSWVAKKWGQSVTAGAEIQGSW